MPDGKDKLKKLHSNLVKDGYELPDYSTFEKDMSDSNKLFKLRENLVKDGYELPDQNTFRNDMGYGEPTLKKKESTSNDGGLLGGVTQSTSNPQLKLPKGLIENGNIDLSKQPSVDNKYVGGKSTVWSMSIGTDKGEVLISRVTPDGKVLSEKEAKDYYYKTGKHLGIFKSIDDPILTQYNYIKITKAVK